MKTAPPGVLLEVRVKPRSSREGVARTTEGGLEVRVKAAPVEGEANEAVLKVLGRALGLRPSQLTIERGHQSRRKLIRISGVSPEELARLLPAPPPP